MQFTTRFLAILGAVLASQPVVHASSLVSRTVEKRATICNGYAELCERSYGSLAYVGTHNSYAVGVNQLSANQDHNITTQLNDGVRLLQVQAHLENGVIRLCHTSCQLFDGDTFEKYLGTVRTWLDANPNEVLSILIVNADNVPAGQYAAAYAATGLDSISYRPPNPALGYLEWPTLGELIDSNQRLVTFLSTTANQAEVPYLIDQFTNVWETAFNVVTSFDCNVNRQNGDPQNMLYLVNHYLDKLLLGQPVPFIERLNETNAASGPGSLGEQVERCSGQHGRPPNFLLVDFYEYGGGSVFQVASQINGVPYDPVTPVARPQPTSAGTQTSTPRGNNAQPFVQGSHLVALASLFVGSVIVAPFLVL
ncbi:PLC-like phosphodiesterase [Coprinopsis marcescibilis]|uniref:PLC-like phosphodiesterase n=1 Tax=Coprinopsis marcescibilis TaxID=230819 RepID=A0A5C3LG41_COPMA|nr:PLC-like phosphodiesterase [Coprinopsis marcescibilis]